MQTTTLTNKIDPRTVNPNFDKYVKLATSWKLKFFLLAKLPMAFWAGLKVLEINEESSKVSIPFKFLNQNPFQSMYFASQAMAAELATGVVALAGIYEMKPKTAMLVSQMEAKFFKKAKEKIYFTCPDAQKVYAAIAKTKETGEWETASVRSIGATKDGVVVSEFVFEWSFRSRLS